MKSEKDLIGRAVVDAPFRARLLADPDGVIDAEGYVVSDETRARIREAARSTPASVEAAISAAARDGGVGA
jgi:hypothetical protein